MADAKNATTTLKPCPICGKKPKIHSEGRFDKGWYRECCVIECKPFLRKPHLKVEATWTSWESALNMAISDWNRRVNDG